LVSGPTFFRLQFTPFSWGIYCSRQPYPGLNGGSWSPRARVVITPTTDQLPLLAREAPLTLSLATSRATSPAPSRTDRFFLSPEVLPPDVTTCFFSCISFFRSASPRPFRSRKAFQIPMPCIPYALQSGVLMRSPPG